MPQLDRRVAVLGTGSALPDRVVTNAELAGMVRNYDHASGDFAVWVDRVTHIQERRFIDPETETSGTLGLTAGRRAIEAAGIDPTDIDHLIFASFTYHEMFPGENTYMVSQLGCEAGTFTLAAACAGSLWGMTIARSLVQSGQCRNVLVIGSETLTRVTNLDDPITAILFGDAAGAVVIGRKDDGEDTGFLGPSVHKTRYGADNITMANANIPRRAQFLDGNERRLERQYLAMAGGPRVLRNAVNAMAEVVCEVLGFTLSDLKDGNDELRSLLSRVKLVPHQANGRIVEGLREKLGVPIENCYRTLYFAGNPSAASNLLTLDHAVREGNLWREDPPEGTEQMGRISPCGQPIRKGDLVVVTSIGAGYLFGATAFVHAY